MKRKLVIIDDEKRTRELIGRMVDSFDLEVDIIGYGENVDSGVSLIDKAKPDIVLLDIQMPDGTGFDLLRSVQHNTFKVIFITAHEEFAIKAIKFSALDYILKPVDPDELENSLKKAISASIGLPTKSQMDALYDNMRPSKKSRLVLKTHDSVHVVELATIIRCEADSNYTTFFLDTNKKITVSKTLKEYETLLSAHRFLRVQQSHLVNLEHVARYDKTEGGAVVMSDGSKVPLSPAKRDQFFKILENL